MTHAVEGRGRRQLVAAERMLRRFMWVGASIALSCSDATAPTDSGVALVAVTPPASTITVGAELPLQAVVQDATGRTITNASVFWSTKDPSIASVTSSGVVTGLAVGATQVSASAGGKSAVSAITVQRVPVASVVVRPTNAAVAAGDRVQFTATVHDANQIALTDRSITWSSSNEAVATVSPTGMATGVSPGVATITATSEVRSDAATITVTLVPVASVEVTPNPVAMSVGQSTQLTATPRDAGGVALTGRTITWSSSNTNVATVSALGVVNAVAAGTAIVTATIEGKPATVSVTVTLVPVATVTVVPSTATVFVQNTVTLSATTSDVSGNTLTGRTVTWTTNASAVATVSPSGVVTGVTPGTATITATSEGKSGTATVTVTLAPVASVEVTPNPVAMSVGQSTQLTATPRDAGGVTLTGRTITWSSSNTNVATVSSQGVVNAVAAGTAIVTATIEGKSAAATVTVTPVPVATVTVVPSTATVFVQNTVTLSATTSDVSGNTLTGRTVTWTTNASAVATVSPSGVVTGVAPGTATITATSEGKSGTATVTVTLAAVATVTVQPSTATVASGSTTTLTATVTDENGGVLTDRVVTWSSSDPSVATVSSAGVVTGELVGTVTITASAEGKSGNASVTVRAGPVATVRVTPTSTTVERGTRVDLTAEALDAAGNSISGASFSWASSDPSVASVNGAGQVNTKKEGTVTITATTGGVSGSATIRVTR